MYKIYSKQYEDDYSENLIAIKIDNLASNLFYQFSKCQNYSDFDLIVFSGYIGIKECIQKRYNWVMLLFLIFLF